MEVVAENEAKRESSVRRKLIPLFIAFILGELLLYSQTRQVLEVHPATNLSSLHQNVNHGEHLSTTHPSIPSIPNFTQIPNKKRILTFAFERWTRLGNHMFALSSVLGLAATNNMTVQLPPNKDIFKSLYNIFKLPTTRNLQTRKDKDVEFTEIDTKSFRCNSTRFLNNFTSNVRLRGYMQCFHNFATVSSLISREFSFLDAIQSKAERVIKQIAKKSVTVGMHVRRGDFIKYEKRGLSVAPLSFFKKAMKYFEKLHHDVHFIVASDDRQWVIKSLKSLTVTPTPFLSAGEDLAVLVNCNHVIISSGTFSWWAGWLNKGTVIYYKNYPRPESPASRDFIAREYYPQNWIGMT